MPVMIPPKPLATSVANAGETFVVALSRALRQAQTECSSEDYERFKRAVGAVIGTLEIELMWPLYKSHPELEPENLRGWKDET
jgi:hypothetical protein